MQIWKGVLDMAQMYSNISIICFFLSAACFIVAIIVFFSLHIPETIQKIRDQSQIKWILLKDKKEEKVAAAPGVGNKNRNRELGEEDFTVSADGEVRKASLVGFYEDETQIMNGEGEIDIELEEEQTELELQTEDVFPKGEFKITQSILYIHTDEVI